MQNLEYPNQHYFYQRNGEAYVQNSRYYDSLNRQRSNSTLEYKKIKEKPFILDGNQQQKEKSEYDPLRDRHLRAYFQSRIHREILFQLNKIENPFPIIEQKRGQGSPISPQNVQLVQKFGEYTLLRNKTPERMFIMKTNSDLNSIQRMTIGQKPTQFDPTNDVFVEQRQFEGLKFPKINSSINNDSFISPQKNQKSPLKRKKSPLRRKAKPSMLNLSIGQSPSQYNISINQYSGQEDNENFYQNAHHRSVYLDTNQSSQYSNFLTPQKGSMTSRNSNISNMDRTCETISQNITDDKSVDQRTVYAGFIIDYAQNIKSIVEKTVGPIRPKKE